MCIFEFFSPVALVLDCATGAVAGRQTFSCAVNNRIASVMCSFDGGTAENCSFPVVAEISRFGTDNHTLDVTVVDTFGQTASASFSFRLIERKLFSCIQTSHKKNMIKCFCHCSS